MAGTRLAVHATFLVEIVFLTGLSLFYATLPPTDLELGSIIRTDTEPFLVDRSGLGHIPADIDDRLDTLEGLGRAAFSSLASLEPDQAKTDATLLLTTKPMCTVMVSALDEDPGSYQSPRRHHEMIGMALGGTVSEIIQPLLDQLSDITQFTIKTQTLAYGQLSSEAKTMMSNNRYAIGSKDVRSFWSQHGNIISSSRRLSPKDERGSSCYLDLIIYVPKKDRTPLSIADKGVSGVSEAFLLPGKRGTVAIANLDLPNSDDSGSSGSSQEKMYAKAVLKATTYLMEYLRSATGLSLLEDKPDTLKREILRAKYEVALAEIRAVWNVIKGASRMRVSSESGEQIAACLENLQTAIDAVKSGDVSAALTATNAALTVTQKLATDGDMMEQMYFPQDHYLAVFTPLILPLLLPLLLGLVREYKRFKKLENGERYDDGDGSEDEKEESTEEGSDKKTQ
mmetsp:Transcript_25516/g.73787  ORF Transcript_25516/g.73787 Transcript_25516/m.73787 type:complete len:454 (-) Transcript_25516:1263-2624(-)|eukprot:CAMPEP_0181022018 /NCGR_PEP_ID=MMETSP1070-20121207/1292_1 /TAXON_ID=265543 /ORGANISM="Minutocellus polymorphus, Strain NH13" /LENGTH=453 /DNA_ID=CAMNT_0023098935 /DNA_START=80 /DNA_END=1441 /DNA_ORIENTATION=-